MIKDWIKSGNPWIWLTASAVSVSLILVFGLLLLIATRGLAHFWPKDLLAITYLDRAGETRNFIGEIHGSEIVSAERLRDSGFDINVDNTLYERLLLKIGNRDLGGQDFKWVVRSRIQQQSLPAAVFAAERREWGNFYGYLVAVKQEGEIVAQGEHAVSALEERLGRAQELYEQIRDIEKDEIGAINYGMERLRLKQRKMELDKNDSPENLQSIEQERSEYRQQYDALQNQLIKLYKDIERDAIVAKTADGQEVDLPLAKIVRVYYPNAMSLFGKVLFYLEKILEFVSDEPREANTEGGVFPAIFGTVMMVMIMSVMVTPFGVVAAVYLREYAKQGILTRTIRIAVNNLAGVPSIVYGVFGLGFFVYFLGGNIDQLFFPESAPSPMFGTPGILWSSLTLAILTVPVVIVATEEGLSRIPKAIREGSLALGATKAETLWRTVLPMASPAVMTGLILAIARAAGEVAPLMLVGVVKLAPSLPMDANAPFLHLDRKFMHLGFHIYDVGFQSPNVEAARPLVYATALLLVLVIVVLNLTAIAIRNHLREKYRSLEQ
ncbi:MAG: phosphate ABC transporter permease PstA [Gammaproteobacteria bacterium]|nr:phosphate ABC transporter permease PstA [Gammaproteobacteria bacterium]